VSLLLLLDELERITTSRIGGRPVAPDLTEHLYEELGVTQPADEQLGWPFLIFLIGVARAMGELPTIVRDTDEGPGWSAVLDVDRCPVWALPWLGQFVGVTLNPGQTEAQQRALVSRPPAFRRGTVAALKEALRAQLTGNRTILLTERDGSPYRITVSVYASQTPNPAQAEAAARSQKPAGLIMTFNLLPGWSIAEMETAYIGQTIADLEGDYPTVNDLETHLV
jgi:hypothetical protein